MTIYQAHKHLHTIDYALSDRFATQLEQIHPDANLCYQSHYETFTVSLFVPRSNILEPNLTRLFSTDGLDLIVDRPLYNLPSFNQLAEDLTNFIINTPLGELNEN